MSADAEAQLFQAFKFKEILAHGLPNKFGIRRIAKFGMLVNKVLNLINKVRGQRNSAIFLRRHRRHNGAMRYNLYYAIHSVIIKYIRCVIHGVRWFKWRVVMW